MSNPDLEAQLTPRIKDALNAAILQTGRDEFAKLSGTEVPFLDRILQGEGEYVSVAVVTLACQVNRSHSDPELAHTSISECLRGAILRLPQQESPLKARKDEESPLKARKDEVSSIRRRRSDFLKATKRRPGRHDASSLRVIGYTANILVFFLVGYFLGGVAIGPLFGFSPCLGVVGGPPWVTPCTGSILGLILGAIFWLVYTYYYFVKKF